jgi:hypothetical protein
VLALIRQCFPLVPLKDHRFHPGTSLAN